MEDEESLSEIKARVEIIADTIGGFMYGGLIIAVVVIFDFFSSTTFFGSNLANPELALTAMFLCAFGFAGVTYTFKEFQYNYNKRGKDK